MRLIDADLLRAKIVDNAGLSMNTCNVLQEIDDAPTVMEWHNAPMTLEWHSRYDKMPESDGGVASYLTTLEGKTFHVCRYFNGVFQEWSQERGYTEIDNFYEWAKIPDLKEAPNAIDRC